MMKTPWSHRIIWALDCLFFGFLLDLILPMPQVSYLSALALFLAGFLGFEGLVQGFFVDQAYVHQVFAQTKRFLGRLRRFLRCGFHMIQNGDAPEV